MRIHIHRVIPQETNQRNPALVSQFDRQARRGRNGSDTGNTRQQSLLNDLKRSTSTHQQQMPMIRKSGMQQAMPNDLIDGVMPTYILTQQAQLPLLRKQTCRVQASGMAKHRLSRAQLR